MKIYIFPRSIDHENRHAGIIASEVETLVGKSLERRNEMRVEKRGLFERKDGLPANKVKGRGQEVKQNIPISIHVDPSLSFTAENIAEDHSFGNTCSSGAVRLKDGTWKACTFFVVDTANEDSFNSKIAQLKTICEQ